MGSILYNGTSYGGGGSGSEVIPNPQGTPTDTLSTIQIGNDIFDIEGGGGSGYSSTLLWDYVTDNAGTIPYGTYSVTLNDAIENYDILIGEIKSISEDSGVWDNTSQMFIDVNTLINSNNPNRYLYTSYGNRGSGWYISGTTMEKVADSSGSNGNGLIRVYGLKFSSGSGGTNVEPNPTDEPTDTLSTIKIGNTIYDITGSGREEIEYSTDEFDTGMTWTDGKKIYGIVINDWQNIATNEYRVTDFWKHGVDAFVNIGGYILNGNNKYLMPYCAGSNYASVAYNTNMGVLILYSNVGVSQGTIYVYYTKSS